MAENVLQYEAVIDTIRTWTPAQRLTLVQDVLTSLTPTIAARARRPTLSRALGLLATAQPAPSDEEITTLLDRRRQERYGQ